MLELGVDAFLAFAIVIFVLAMIFLYRELEK